MANDIVLNPGVGGATVSTEALTSGGDGAQAQRVKIITGAANVDGGNVTTSNPFPAGITDGTNGTVAVKAASTAAGAADKSLVVQQSPNSPNYDTTNGVTPMVDKPLAVSTYAATPFGTGVTPAATIQAKASAGILRSVYATNRTNANTYLMLFNQNGSTPNVSNIVGAPITLPANGGSVALDEAFFSRYGIYFSIGILIGVSSSGTSWSADTAANHDIMGVLS